MSTTELLLQAYERFVRLPWEKTLAGPRKVWFLVYEPVQERRLRYRLAEFETATLGAGHTWHMVDLTDVFARWMANHDYREQYFEQPEDMQLALQDFSEYVVEHLTAALTVADADDNTVVAVVGVASLFGLTRTSQVLERVAGAIRGRLLVFFPGQRDGSNYRFLDARDGWNYLAVPITATEGG